MNTFKLSGKITEKDFQKKFSDLLKELAKADCIYNEIDLSKLEIVEGDDILPESSRRVRRMSDEEWIQLANVLRDNNKVKHLDLQESGISARGLQEFSKLFQGEKRNKTIIKIEFDEPEKKYKEDLKKQKQLEAKLEEERGALDQLLEEGMLEEQLRPNFLIKDMTNIERVVNNQLTKIEENYTRLAKEKLKLIDNRNNLEEATKIVAKSPKSLSERLIERGEKIVERIERVGSRSKEKILTKEEIAKRIKEINDSLENLNKKLVELQKKRDTLVKQHEKVINLFKQHKQQREIVKAEERPRSQMQSVINTLKSIPETNKIDLLRLEEEKRRRVQNRIEKDQKRGMQDQSLRESELNMIRRKATIDRRNRLMVEKESALKEEKRLEEEKEKKEKKYAEEKARQDALPENIIQRSVERSVVAMKKMRKDQQKKEKPLAMNTEVQQDKERIWYNKIQKTELIAIQQELINELLKYIKKIDEEIKNIQRKQTNKHSAITWGGLGTDLVKKRNLAQKALKGVYGHDKKTPIYELFKTPREAAQFLEVLNNEDKKIRWKKGGLGKILEKYADKFSPKGHPGVVIEPDKIR